MRLRSIIRWYINHRIGIPYMPPPPIVVPKPPPPIVPPKPPTAGPKPPAVVLTALESHNEYRLRERLRPFQSSESLDRQAAYWAGVISELNSLPHAGYRQRLQAAGFSDGSENLHHASWATSAVEATQSWMDSEGHKENILNGSWTHAGFGFSDGRSGRFWVGLYGRK